MAYAGCRVASDGGAYTYASFCDWYGNAAAERIWQESHKSEEGCNAAHARMEPTATEHGNQPHLAAMAYAGYRVALDGEPYTYESFCTWYGNAAAERIWQASPWSEEGCNAARARMEPTATEHGNPPHTQVTPAATEPGNTARTELVESAASALSLVPILTLADAQELRRREQDIRPKRSLHNLAREALNSISQSAELTEENTEELDARLRSIDLETLFPWRAYIACHPRSSEIIGSGVIHATAEFINGTKDPNRGGQRRLDFIVRRSDGSLCRLHPGRTRAGDAKLIFSSG